MAVIALSESAEGLGALADGSTATVDSAARPAAWDPAAGGPDSRPGRGKPAAMGPGRHRGAGSARLSGYHETRNRLSVRRD
jgi:hypothetical protein